MPTIDERVAFLEGKVEEHLRGFEALREAVLHLDARSTAGSTPSIRASSGWSVASTLWTRRSTA